MSSTPTSASASVSASAATSSNTLLLRAVILAGLFLGAVGSAWAWYNVNPKRFDTAYEFTPRTQISGLEYEAFAVDATTRETLATTNLFNGVFKLKGESKFVAFLATWNAADSKQMGVVAHTPDICWVGAGWVPVSLGQPRSTNILVNGVSIPFEVRAFRAGDHPRVELTVWCTLVSGQVFDEGNRFEPPAASTEPSGANDALLNQAANSRTRSGGQFIRVVRERIAGDGSKQFVRFSTGVETDWRKSLEELQKFAGSWLTLNVTHPAGAISAKTP